MKMSKLTKIGQYVGSPALLPTALYRSASGTICASYNQDAGDSEDADVVGLISPRYGESVEGFIDALRAATEDPKDTIIALARVAVQCRTITSLDALAKALDAAEAGDDE